MRHIIEHTEFDVYTFEELSPESQEKAIEWWQDQEASEPYHWWHDCFKALEEFCGIFNVTIRDYSVVAYSPSYVELDLDRYDTSWGMAYSDVEHLAKCMGIFSQERRAEMLNGKSQWVDGIHWKADGSFIEL